MTVLVIIAVALLGGTAAYAWCYGRGSYGMGYGRPYSNVNNVQKLAEGDNGLRDELATKRIELQNEYAKPNPDPRRIVTLKKEIIDLEAKNQDTAADYNTPEGGYMGGMPGRGWSRGMYSCPGCGCGW